MASVLQVATIKDQGGNANAIEIANSSANVTINNLAAGTIGSAVTGFTGVKILDQWRLTTTLQGVANPISSNLEKTDTANQGTFGSAMTQSSGIFTFPMTGIYLLFFNSTHNLPSGEVRYIGPSINKVISGSASILSQSYIHINNAQASTTYQASSIMSTFDCTDTSTDKVSFSVLELSDTTTYTMGSSTYNFTSMTFVRLGDT